MAMYKRLLLPYLFLTWATPLLALQITSPTKGQVVDLSKGAFVVRWNSVSSDPTTAHLLFVNEAGGRLPLSLDLGEVPIADGSFSFSGYVVPADTTYQFTLFSEVEFDEGILAQSPQFTVTGEPSLPIGTITAGESTIAGAITTPKASSAVLSSSSPTSAIRSSFVTSISLSSATPTTPTNFPTSAASSGTTTLSSTDHSSTETSSLTSVKAGLSSGAKIGIGVGISLVVIIALLLGIVLLVRCRRKRETGDAHGNLQEGYDKSVVRSEPEHRDEKVELPGRISPDASGKAKLPSEGISSDTRASELEGFSAPANVHELDSTIISPINHDNNPAAADLRSQIQKEESQGANSQGPVPTHFQTFSTTPDATPTVLTQATSYDQELEKLKAEENRIRAEQQRIHNLKMLDEEEQRILREHELLLQRRAALQ
jgi:hypothetical protein